MKENSVTAIADALNDRRRTTAALAMVADLIHLSGYPKESGLDCSCVARAELLDMFVEKMLANDDLIDRLIRDGANDA